MIIDVHHHYLPKSYVDDIEKLVPPEVVVARQADSITLTRRKDGWGYMRIDPPLYSADHQLADMDAAGVDHSVLSPACFQDWMTLEAAQLINDGTAELAARFPERFSGMISVPPDGGEAMVREIVRARDMGLSAISITTTYQGKFPDHEDFRLLFGTAAEMGLPIFVHPSWHGPVLTYMGEWNLERSVGKATDLTLAVARLLFAGLFSRYPTLQMMFAHLGGALPITRRRLFFGPPGHLAAPDFDYAAFLQRVFVDTAPGIWQSPLEIGFAARSLGSAQLMMGSDYPMSRDPAHILRASVEHVREAEISLDDKEKIFFKNALDFFGLRRLQAQLDGSSRSGTRNKSANRREMKQ